MEQQIGIYGLFLDNLHLHYIGSAIDILKHFSRDHMARLRRGKHWNADVQRAFDEHGEEIIKLIICELVEDITKLPHREKVWQRYMRRQGQLVKQRISGTPGMRGKRHTRETRIKMARSKTRKDSQVRAFVSPEGEIHRPEIRSELCEKFNLSPSELSKLASGQIPNYRGWVAVQESPELVSNGKQIG